MNQKIVPIRQILIAVMLVFSATVFVSCEKYEWVKTEIKPNLTDTVHFQSDIVPIFTSNCSSSNCHGGSFSPDLRPNKAFISLTNEGLITPDSPETPETCGLYQAIISDAHSTRTSTTDAEKQKVLSWIAQGALNN